MEDETPCKRCTQPRPLGDYRIWPKSGKRAKTCEHCLTKARNDRRRERAKLEGITESGRYRRENPEKVEAWRRQYRKRNLDHVLAIKADTPCADCGHKFPPVCMDFDHLEDNKEASISELMNQGASLARIDAEIAKCELVCSNCHRIRTADRGGWHVGRNYGPVAMVRVSS